MKYKGIDYDLNYNKPSEGGEVWLETPGHNIILDFHIWNVDSTYSNQDEKWIYDQDQMEEMALNCLNDGRAWVDYGDGDLLPLNVLDHD